VCAGENLLYPRCFSKLQMSKKRQAALSVNPLAVPQPADSLFANPAARPLVFEEGPRFSKESHNGRTLKRPGLMETDAHFHTVPKQGVGKTPCRTNQILSVLLFYCCGGLVVGCV
jgi:hypothetical protein